jgi:hypothetical protein
LPPFRVQVRQRATLIDVLESLVQHLYPAKELSERPMQRRMHDSLYTELRAVKGQKSMVTIKVPLTLRWFLAFHELLELEFGDDKDTLVFTYTHYDVTEKLAFLLRIFGTRIFKLTDIGSNNQTRYLVLMAQASGSAELTFNVKTQVVKMQVMVHAFTDTFADSGGAPITPSCPEPKNIVGWHFSLPELKWKKGPNRDKNSIVDKKVTPFADAAAVHFGMNGTEL